MAQFVCLVNGEGREEEEWIAVNSGVNAVNVVLQQRDVAISGVLVQQCADLATEG